MGRVRAQEFLVMPLTRLGCALAFGNLPEFGGSQGHQVKSLPVSGVWSPGHLEKGLGLRLGIPGSVHGGRVGPVNAHEWVLGSGPKRLCVWGESVAA